MRIGIDCRTILNPKLGERAGVGHYTYYLVKHLLKVDHRNEYVLYFDHRIPNLREFERPNTEVKRLPFSQYNKFLPFAYSHMLISAYLLKEGLDLFHSPISSVPLTYPKKTVVTVHDLAIYKNPAWFPSQIFSTRLLVPRTLNSADKIISVSESTRKDLKEIFNIPAKKMTVIHEGVSVERIHVNNKRIDSLSKFKLWSKYLFFVGTLEPRKNLTTLLRAYKKLLEWGTEFSKVQLVLAGAKGYKSDEVFDEIKELKLRNQVKYIGYITHNQKMELIKRAACFVFPSLYEGFGLPVLEAMALGTPVVTSNCSSLPEITGDAALQVNPDVDYEMAAAMKKVLTDGRLAARLRERGRARAKEFSWDRCAQETIAVYKTVK